MQTYELFSKNTEAFIYNLKAAPIQRMLDFDFICKRSKPSVAAVIQPGGDGYHKAFFGTSEVLIPIYSTIAKAALAHPNADVMVNFASFRSAYPSSKEALETKTIRTVAIIAEGMPEREVRQLVVLAQKNKKMIIGPATVGGITAGAFRIGNTAGTIENIISCKLYRPGHVGFVSKSGGLTNEMCNVIGRTTDGVYEAIAIGGDRYPGSTMLEHMLRFEQNPEIKMIVGLGELGGDEEYAIIDAKKKNLLKKPIVMWVAGTCAKMFPGEVQFGHAGAKTGKQTESADAKNKALRESGIIVPNSFEDFDKTIATTFQSLNLPAINEPEVPRLPLDYDAAVKKAMIRKPTNFISSISDDRKDEPYYAGIPMSKLIEEDYSVGDVISLLWFKKKLPKYATKFIETCIIIAADHGPAVSGAHNAIVAARAGKDTVSSLCSGLLTIGPRFGGAIDDAARYFKDGCDKGMSAEQFVDDMKKKGILIPGIGHRIKSAKNPDKRVELLKEYAKKNFPSHKYLDYALAVEQVTLKKADNLILNVDGCIGVLFVDLFDSCSEFSKEEVSEMVELGYLNGVFVLARSIGLMGHVFDQKRLKQPLYRHPWDDILFL
ncbi:Succinate--CoA ligase [ADP-forming] subunit alpha [Candidatus Bilamarchaeum dharawalense]|uniref:ATP citrate synthase n=1 Tax=Candidatus Bilamarchaeum dharawalense TaxID=2885759 RepID=A0A5E4LMN9_9ARCH|nr:Succinate--CoA ligase [ADP-forming] subunit alpha [Candidatus Bilamarchaeum dharawalense]